MMFLVVIRYLRNEIWFAVRCFLFHSFIFSMSVRSPLRLDDFSKVREPAKP
jgi:hypothetical protein